jgi:hypothetical protein
MVACQKWSVLVVHPRAERKTIGVVPYSCWEPIRMLPSSPDDDMAPPVPLCRQDRDEQFYECPQVRGGQGDSYRGPCSQQLHSSYVPNVLARRSVSAFNRPRLPNERLWQTVSVSLSGDEWLTQDIMSDASAGAHAPHEEAKERELTNLRELCAR